MADQEHVTQLLDEVARGNENAAAELWDAVHCEVHQMATSRLFRERQTASLQPTMVVNEICRINLKSTNALHPSR